jgi:acetyl-CoA carboxylase carboxyltransferase component
MTEGSGLYLAGPALVKAAIGQEVTDEELGGASMHASISGTIDFKEKDDESCLERLRGLLAKYGLRELDDKYFVVHRVRATRLAAKDASEIYDAFTDKPGAQYDVKQVIACLVDARMEPPAQAGGSEPASAPTQPPGSRRGLHQQPDFDEYKADFGQSLVCGYATIGGHACGIVANQKKLVQRIMPGGKTGPTKAVQMPGVIYDDSADKAARFIMDCNQRKIPTVFLHDTTGFMVGRDSEQGGIIRAGAKMVNAMSNCVVPKIVVITGGSYGAGNYAMCGRAFDQFMAFAWPSAKCAVMGANQATGVLTTIEEASRKRKGETIDPEAHEKIYAAIHAAYTQQTAITHAAARGWVDRMIEPHKTRDELIAALSAANQGWDYSREFKTGVLQT